jgi:hypothetical protein
MSGTVASRAVRFLGDRCGYPELVTEPVKHVEEKVEELAHEAEEGTTARTPLLLMSGVLIVVGSVVAVLLILAFLAYYLS